MGGILEDFRQPCFDEDGLPFVQTRGDPFACGVDRCVVEQAAIALGGGSEFGF